MLSYQKIHLSVNTPIVATMTVAAMTARWDGMRKDSRHADDQTSILLQFSRRRIIHLKNEQC
ncbi:hypothetical protein D2M30_2546 [Bacillus amyloliquefaciens]|uniref:hypothetical protein n=1 Tax=Bacillus amyloliquefaciens TaxID=1390 RepID=UPI0010C3501D|nr:hypothetical protein [Bacillus amyloliquefaciens]QBG56875.1 hypothetical protein D2M30_2546 [Bacillus amyloliquefaciens]